MECTAPLIVLAAGAACTAQPVEWPRADGGNGHFYEYVEAKGIEWSGADAGARRREHLDARGRLASITSEEENRFIMEHVVPEGVQEAWLGGRPSGGGGWAWVSGERWSYQNWQPGEPNGRRGDERLAIVPGSDGQWNDERLLFNVKGYVVEYEVGGDRAREAAAPKAPAQADDAWTSAFRVDPAELGPTGRNPYFVLEPGYVLEFVGPEGSLEITVLNETRRVDGVETRVVEERETEGGELVEVSRNYFAISGRTNSVYYFGEVVDVYKDGKVVGHEGAWLAGRDGARFGMMMPGDALLGARHYQEVAPGVAMDRAEIVSLTESLTTPAGRFETCLKVLETTPLEPDAREFKLYAPGVGLIQDGSMRLVRRSEPGAPAGAGPGG